MNVSQITFFLGCMAGILFIKAANPIFFNTLPFQILFIITIINTTKLSKMLEFTTQFLKFVNKLPNERRRILFGDPERLKQLFAEHDIPSNNVRYSIFNKFFCIKNLH